jgi:hypothetical protein
VAEIFSDIGKGIKKIFAPSKKSASVAIPVVGGHDLVSFGIVYANEPARAALDKKDSLQFPAGSILVREKNAAMTSETPDTLIVMVKREKGFSTETGDWEFFTFNGSDLKMQKRETTGDCAKCHIQVEKTD